MKHFNLWIFFLIIFYSCHSSSQEHLKTASSTLPTIDLSDEVTKKESLLLSDAVAKIDVVSLEVTDQSILGDINQAVVTTHNIWVSHSKEAFVYRFSREGKFLNKVGKVGQGPGEYSQLSQFFVDEIQKEVYAVSIVNGINIYDFEGNFKRKLTQLTLDDLFATPSGKIFLYNRTFFLSQNLPVMRPLTNPVDSLWSVALADSNFKIKKRFKNPVHKGREEMIVKNRSKPETFENPNYWTEGPMNIDLYGNTFKIKYPDTDTIYQYDSVSTHFIPIYTIYSTEEKGDYELTHVWIKERKAFDYFTIVGYYDTYKYIYLTGRKGKNIFTYQYDKENGKVEVTERKGEFMEYQFPWFANPFLRLNCPFILTNDLCGGNFQVKYRSDGKYWIDVLEYGTEDKWPDRETIQKSEVKDAAAKQKLLKVLNETGENSNPVLVIATLYPPLSH